MKERKPIQRRTPLKPSTKPIMRSPIKKKLPAPYDPSAPNPEKKIYKIPQRSKKENERQKKYMEVLIPYLEKHTECLVPEGEHHEDCDGRATQNHHKRGKIGELLWDVRFFTAISYPCHCKAENNPKWAKSIGISLDRLSDYDD